MLYYDVGVSYSKLYGSGNKHAVMTHCIFHTRFHGPTSLSRHLKYSGLLNGTDYLLHWWLKRIHCALDTALIFIRGGGGRLIQLFTAESHLWVLGLVTSHALVLAWPDSL